jgi:DNA (cytosine-5)-methyltransferase 1
MEKTCDMAIQQSVNGPLRELTLFAGAGGGILGGKLLGWRTVCAVERNAYCAAILAQRQNEGYLEPFPIWSDVTSFDGTRWRGIVDVVSGGFPCQDISCAGKGAGLDGERSGLWAEMARIISEVRPRFAFVENSPMLTSRGLDRVLGDFSSMGFNAEWGVVSAADAIWTQGRPCIDHERERIWIIAKNADATRNEQGRKKQRSKREPVGSCGEYIAACSDSGLQQGGNWSKPNKARWSEARDNYTCSNTNETRLDGDDNHKELSRWVQSMLAQSSWWESEPDVGRVANGVPNRVDRLAALGNAQVPLCAALAWKLLSRME